MMYALAMLATRGDGDEAPPRMCWVLAGEYCPALFAVNVLRIDAKTWQRRVVIPDDLLTFKSPEEAQQFVDVQGNFYTGGDPVPGTARIVQVHPVYTRKPDGYTLADHDGIRALVPQAQYS